MKGEKLICGIFGLPVLQVLWSKDCNENKIIEKYDFRSVKTDASRGRRAIPVIITYPSGQNVTFDSVTNASACTGESTTRIRKALKSKVKMGGFYWSTENANKTEDAVDPANTEISEYE